jgi:hypothetical protein
VRHQYRVSLASGNNVGWGGGHFEANFPPGTSTQISTGCKIAGTNVLYGPGQMLNSLVVWNCHSAR